MANIESLEDVVIELNNKADRDFANVANSQSYLVESWQEGTSFYRVYSDGWCVQGGFIRGNLVTEYVHVDLLKPYVDNNYNIQLTLVSEGNSYTDSAAKRYNAIAYKTRTGFQTYVHTSTALSDKLWLACGYIERSES